jgi:hypothetical protein
MFRTGDRVRVKEDARSLHPPPGTVGTIWGTSIVDSNPIVDFEGIGRKKIPPGDLTIVLPPRQRTTPPPPSAAPVRRTPGRPRKDTLPDELPIMVNDGDARRLLGEVARHAGTEAPTPKPAVEAPDCVDPRPIYVYSKDTTVPPPPIPPSYRDTTIEGVSREAHPSQVTTILPWQPKREPYLAAGHAAEELDTTANALTAIANVLGIRPQKVGPTSVYAVSQVRRLADVKAVMDELGVPAAIAKKAMEWKDRGRGH